ncbi:MAG: MFS transporter [Bacteriovoracia bacterium]
MGPLLPIFLIVAVDVLALTIVIPLMPFYAEHFGASPAVVGYLGASFALCQLISGPILGQLSDRFGRKPMLLISQVGTFAGFLIQATAQSLAWVFCGRLMDGITAGNLSIAQAYISDVTAPENRAKAFGVIGIAFGLGFLVGPAISAALSGFGIHMPFIAAATLSALSIVATYFLLPGKALATSPTPAKEGARRTLDWRIYTKYFRDPQIASYLLLFFCFTLSFALFISGFALFAERRFLHHGTPWGPKQVGYLFAYAGFLGLIVQGGLLGRLVKWLGERKLALVGFTTATAGYFLLSQSRELPGLIVATTLSSLGHGVLRPAITSLVSRAVGPTEQGTVLGLTQSLNSISLVIAPLFSGYLIHHQWLEAWALMPALCAAIGATISTLSLRKAVPHAT